MNTHSILIIVTASEVQVTADTMSATSALQLTEVIGK